MVSTFAQNEQNFNAVERILVYTELPAEGVRATPEDPEPAWPTKGAIEFDKVELAYRPGLPLVLKKVSFSVRPGEKVGVVGRTGAGKSSMMQALFRYDDLMSVDGQFADRCRYRMVELHSGKITIDGVDIRQVGLTTLRERLAFVPQDSTLFVSHSRLSHVTRH
jgi:ATP-binding cassette subfamily C (CFTR/MRP) protein 1